MSFNKYFIAVLVFLLSSCNLYWIPPKASLSKVEPVFSEKVYGKGGKAYVVLDASHNIGASFPVNSYFVFSKENGEEVELVVSSQPAAFMLSSGTYTLKNYTIYGIKVSGNVTQTVNLNFEGLIDGNFTVTAGDVVYIGHVATNITSIRKPAWAKFLGQGASVKDIEYHTEVINRFAEIKADKLAKFEEQAGRKPVVKLMRWKKK